ncbi:MAG: glycosyltransferase [Actinomycetota bacterium]
MEDIFTYPRVSVCIANLNGKDYLKNCIASIRELDYPGEKIEVIVVDNGSTDGSVEFLNTEFSGVKVIRNSWNLGFAAANNQAAEAAGGKYIAFLNNDTRVDKNWLTELVRPLMGESEIAASGSKVLSSDGKQIDFAGAMINFEGKGFQIDYGQPVEKDSHNNPLYLPFANGGAMLVRADVFNRSGGFDQDFFAYYEDVDFGWRLWVLGYKVVFCPRSIVYHTHHGTSASFSEDKLRFLKERNSLFSVFKNYDDDNLARALAATWGNVFNRLFVDIKFDYQSYYQLSAEEGKLEEELERQAESVSIGKEPLSSLMAVKDFFENLPRLLEKREKIQSVRRRDDKAIFSYFKGQFLAVSPDPQYQQNQINLLKSTGLYQMFEKKIKRTLLIITSEVVSREMAGPAIRVWNFARVLAEHMNVILAVPNDSDLEPDNFTVKKYTDEASLKSILEEADIVLTGGTTFSRYATIKESDKYLVMDIYDPYNLAVLAEYKNEPMEKRLKVHKLVHYNLNEQFYYGDFFMCASERQRDFWLGMAAALDRVNPYSYQQDPTLKKMIEVVPFGLPSEKPMHTRQVLKGVVEGIGPDDFLILWGGGIYNWFDPLTLIKAMAQLGQERQDIKLFFMGVKHPNPEVRELQLVTESVNLAKKLGVYGKNVFFNFGWVPYEERQNYLLESDTGIITHPEQIETRFSFRTRMLDYLWAGLPIISTEGDSLSEFIQKKDLGLVVAAQDTKGLRDAMVRLADDKDFYQKCRENIEKIVPEYRWEKVCRPLIDFCRDPIYSAYRGKMDENDLEDVHKKMNIKPRRKGPFYLMSKFFYHFFKSPRQSFRYLSNYMRGA